MIKINFFDYNSVLVGMSKLYGIDENKIMLMSIKAHCETNPIASFIKMAGIKLDSIDISHVMLHCKHIMTIDDEFASIKKYGLITLDKVLTYETPLHTFLFEHGIEIDVDNRNVFYNGKKIHLYEPEEECEVCFFDGECKHQKFINGKPETLSYRNMACDFRDGISVIRTKLYTHKSEIEVHLSGEIKEVHDYPGVKYHPEILVTLESLIYQLFKESPHLESDWKKKQNGKYYCLDFDINIKDFEMITSKPIFEDYDDYFEFNERPMYGLYNVSPNFYGNIFILKRALGILSGDIPTVYGQIFPEVEIPYDKITITGFRS